jgi:hypothetical protein
VAASPHIAALAVAAAAGALVLWVVWQKLAQHSFDPQSFVEIDGFFVYQLARSFPTLVAPMDIPAYRAQRILLSALAAPFGPMTAWALIGINVASAMAGSYALARIARARGCPAIFGALFGCWIGTLFAVELDLTEVLAYALVLWGIWQWERGRPVAAGALLGAAVLAKETAALYGAAVILGAWASSSWRERARLALLSAGPSVLWQLALIARFGESGLAAAMRAGSPADHMAPLVGLIYADMAAPWAWGIQIGWVLAPALLAAIWGAAAIIGGDRSPAAWCLLLNGLFICALPPASTEYLVHSTRIGLAAIIALSWAVLTLRRPTLALLWLALSLVPLALFQPGAYF